MGIMSVATAYQVDIANTQDIIGFAMYLGVARLAHPSSASLLAAAMTAVCSWGSDSLGYC
jgi:hypothetical protein